VIVLGGVTPAVIFLLGISQPWMGDYGIYIGLGVVCAAYLSHAFFIANRDRTLNQTAAFGLSIILALTYPAWMALVDNVIGTLTVSFEPRLGPGDIGFNGVHMMATPIVTGTIMAIALSVTTRSLAVFITVLVASIVCGVIVFPTQGASCVIWNLAAAIALYRWAGPWPRIVLPLAKCPGCGYSLAGLPTAQCPECGQNHSQPNG
jgi:hypothetical protein